MLLAAIATVGAASPVSGQSPYLRRFGPLADSLGAAYGIPSDLILAVAVLESGSGTSRVARLLNNHFGIVGPNTLAARGISSRYREFPVADSSYVAFCRLLARRPYYARLRGSTDVDAWIQAIAAAGYSEVPAEWSRRVARTASYVRQELSR